MRYTDFIDGVGILDPAEEHDLFRRLDAGAIADAILAGHFLAAVPVSEAELRRIRRRSGRQTNAVASNVGDRLDPGSSGGCVLPVQRLSLIHI